MRRIIIATCLLAAAGVAVAAEPRHYWGGGVASGEYERDGVGRTDVTGVQLHLGTELLPFFALEARVGTGFQNETEVAGVDVKTRVEHWGSLFARAFVDMDRVRPYALIGYTSGRAKAKVPSIGLEASDSDQDVSYGAGVELYGNDSTALFLEWVKYFDTSDYTIDAWALGLSTRF